jgi:hypothetical protein
MAREKCLSAATTDIAKTIVKKAREALPGPPIGRDSPTDSSDELFFLKAIHLRFTYYSCVMIQTIHVGRVPPVGFADLSDLRLTPHKGNTAMSDILTLSHDYESLTGHRSSRWRTDGRLRIGLDRFFCGMELEPRPPLVELECGNIVSQTHQPSLPDVARAIVLPMAASDEVTQPRSEWAGGARKLWLRSMRHWLATVRSLRRAPADSTERLLAAANEARRRRL